MKCLGRPKEALFVFLATFLLSPFLVNAAPLSVRDIQIDENGGAKVILDGTPPKGTVNLEYVRDIVQFSLQNTTIYPAKILHAGASANQTFSKVFAYQYAPNLVRIRFTVDGKAEAYKGKIKLVTVGKELSIAFPKGIVVQGEVLKESDEKSLLAKVLGSTERKEESQSEALPPKDLKARNKQLGAASKPVGELTGRPHGPSVFRSLFAMFLIVGGLGLVLLYVKKKAGASQAKRVGDSWLSGILNGGRKSKAFIEVVANHSIGPKQSITIVRIKDQQFVLGVTQDSVQLITQLDSEEADLELLEDPKVADSIGKMFGSKIKPEPKVAPVSSFDSILKASSGAGAIVARNAYQNQSPPSASVQVVATSLQRESGVRDQIRRRLQQNVGGT